MHRSFFSICCALGFLAFYSACSSEKPTATAVSNEVEITYYHVTKSEGKDCDQPDTLRTACATIDLKWPVLKDGESAFGKSIEQWSNRFLASMMAPELDSARIEKEPVDTIIRSFYNYHAEMVKEAPDSPVGQWVAECDYQVLHNADKLLTLEITGYSFMGGAHGNPTAAVATWDVTTGKQLTWDDVATDKAALLALVKEKYRMEMADLFTPKDEEERFEIDETIFPFTLPANFGLTKEGLYCHYVHYEVGPYAIGATAFTIPYGELGKLLKINI